MQKGAGGCCGIATQPRRVQALTSLVGPPPAGAECVDFHEVDFVRCGIPETTGCIPGNGRAPFMESEITEEATRRPSVHAGTPAQACVEPYR